MEELMNNKLFIPMVILVSAAVISVIVLIVFSKKKKTVRISMDDLDLSLDKPSTDVEKRIVDEATLPIVDVKNENMNVLPDVPIASETNNVLPDVSIVPKVDNTLPDIEVKKEEIEKEPSIKKVELPSGPPPTIDIPIPTIDDSPITVAEAKSLVGEDLKDSVEVEKYEAVDETNVDQGEIIKVTEAKQIVEDNQEPITIEEVKTLTNETGEQIEVEEVKPATNDIGETAFKSIPQGDRNINTDIKVEPMETVSNKTEIFSLEDIQKELNKEENKRELL